MGSLFEELEAREAAARVRVEELEAEVLAEMPPDKPAVVVGAGQPAAKEPDASAYAGVQRQIIGVLAVPNWRPGMGPEVLPQVYRDIVDVVADAPGPVRAKQIVPRIGLLAETGKIESTRSKLKRLVERGRLDEDTPGMFTPARGRTASSPDSQ